MDARVRQILSGGGLVLDVGCGDGEPLDDMGHRYHLAVGIDVSPDRLASRQTRPSKWTFMLSDLNHGIPLASEVADAVHANQVIEHMGNPLFFAMEVHRVLRPGGVFIVTTPNIRYLVHLWRLVVEGQGPITSGKKLRTPTEWDNGHIHFFTPSDLTWIAQEAGFARVRTSALIKLSGKFQPLRQAFDRRAGAPLVKNFLSGNTLMVAVK